MEEIIISGEVELRKDLFSKKRIVSERLRSRKGASVIFAIVGFMFAAMISIVVVNAAYSAATRVGKLKHDEQAFLLAQSMSGIVTNALKGNGNNMLLPDGSSVKSSAGVDLKYDGLTLQYQYIEQKNYTDGSIKKYYNSEADSANFVSGATSDTFYDTVKGKDGISDAAASVRTMIRDMAKLIQSGTVEIATEKLETSYPKNGETYLVTTEFTMDKTYSLKIVMTSTVKKGDRKLSEYIVRMDASADVRTDKVVCVGKRSATDSTLINAVFSDHDADAAGEEMIKVTCYSLTWPPDQIRTVYVSPSGT